MKNFILMGDSHTRSYTSSSKFKRIIFLSQGKKINFTSNKAFISFLTKYIAAALNYASLDTPIALIIGEPDVRLITYGTFDIRKKPDLLLNFSTQAFPIDNAQVLSINKSIKRIEKFIYISKLLNIMPSVLIGASSPNVEMSKICSYFNNKLRELADTNNISFFDPTSLYLNYEKDRSRWIATAYNDPNITDPIHFSSEAAIQFNSFAKDNLAKYATVRSAKNIAIRILSALFRVVFRLEYSSFFKVYKLKSRF